MKFKIIMAAILSCCIISCRKNIDETIIMDGVPPVLTLSPAAVSLTEAQASDEVFAITWSAADFGFDAAINYTAQIDTAGSDFANASVINTGSLTSLRYTGALLNELAISKGITPGASGSLDIRVKASLSDSVFVYSETSTVSVATYTTSLPALLVRGKNSWVTPDERTNGYLLTSVNYDGKYEGYLYLPDADKWGGDAFKLESTTDGTLYGWGTNEYTMSTAEASGNLWFTPAPNYMKVNADVNALTINHVPVQFYISGDNNGWSTSATPLIYNDATKILEADNVSFTAGQKFVFTCNGSYDICYKVDDNGKLIFAGSPVWGGNDIVVNETGTFKITLDLSGGDGNYTYSIE